MCGYVDSSALNKRADQLQPARTALWLAARWVPSFPAPSSQGHCAAGRARDQDPEAELRGAVSARGGPPPTWCGSTAIFVRGCASARSRCSRDSAVGGLAMERWLRSQLRLWLLLLLLPPVPGRQKESGGLRTGPSPPLGLGSGPVPRRSPAPLAPRCGRRHACAVVAAGQSWAGGTGASRSGECV